MSKFDVAKPINVYNSRSNNTALLSII